MLIEHLFLLTTNRNKLVGVIWEWNHSLTADRLGSQNRLLGCRRTSVVHRNSVDRRPTGDGRVESELPCQLMRPTAQGVTPGPAG